MEKRLVEDDYIISFLEQFYESTKTNLAFPEIEERIEKLKKHKKVNEEILDKADEIFGQQEKFPAFLEEKYQDLVERHNNETARTSFVAILSLLINEHGLDTQVARQFLEGKIKQNKFFEKYLSLFK
jgi:hypothetical protein